MNTIGNKFRLTTFGESHGQAIGGIVDGCPAGLVFDYSLVEVEMRRRHAGNQATTRIEPDEVEFLSGIYDGRTLGTPIAFVIRNRDVRSDDYDAMKNLLRPGHADYTTLCRYGIRDPRGGGRASARETASRVVGGAIAKMLLRDMAHRQPFSLESEINISTSVSCGEAGNDDSRGGTITCTIDGVPAGIGDPVFGKLNARLAAAMMSIPSAMGFEIGSGFAAAEMKGSEFRDQWCTDDGRVKTTTNHCGGIQGGISNGMPIMFRIAFHPVVTIPQPTNCITPNGEIETITPLGRHDRCHLPRTAVIVEAMAAMTIADFLIK